MSLSLSILDQLIQRQSTSPHDAGCQEWIRKYLSDLGFQWRDYSQGDTTNTWAWLGPEKKVRLIYAGHTDVVPTDSQPWSTNPYTLVHKDSMLIGRGVADMKGSLSCFLAMLPKLLAKTPNYPLGLILTSDEEASAKEGTKVIVEKLREQQIKPKHILIGEPSCTNKLGDGIRVGRRGSIHYHGTINGESGHSAYPETVHNPIDQFVALTKDLQQMIDQATLKSKGHDLFPSNSLTFTRCVSPMITSNVTPQTLEFSFNLRFNPWCNIHTLQKTFQEYCLDNSIQGSWSKASVPYDGKPGLLTQALTEQLRNITDTAVDLNAGGGTSDGRFLQDFNCEVIEFGHINQSMHQANESIPYEDLETLSAIYYNTLNSIIFKDMN